MKKRWILIIIGLIILIMIYNSFFSVRRVNVLLTGDALINGVILDYNYNEEDDSYDFKDMIKYIKEYNKDYDLKFYNQESSISGDEFKYRGSFCFNTPKEFGLDMIDASFNMVSLANNHTFDGELGMVNGILNCYKSELGVINSLNFWSKYDDVYISGSYYNEEDRDNIVIKKINGISYTLLSYTTFINTDAGYEESPFLVNIYDEEQVRKDVEKVRDKVDVIFVSMHWGYDNEESVVASREQKEQARYLASLGVDVVIGHHPYVIQPVEYIDNTLVFYSLGRLVSDLRVDNNNYATQIGLLSSVLIEKRNGHVKVKNTNNELVYTYINDDTKESKIIPFSKMNSKYNKDYIKLYQDYRQVIKMYDNSIYVNNLNLSN